MDDPLPEPVLASVLGRPGGTVVTCRREPIGGSSGAATGRVTRLSGLARCGGEEVPFSVVRKEVRPVREGRHAPYAGDPRHWAYWRREPLAYASGLLPAGPGLAAPRCHGVVGDVVYLADVTGVPESPHLAARRLGAWQAGTAVPDVPWLAGHQLAQRLATSEWTPVAADPRVARLWARQDELLAELARLPVVLTHGDFSAGNLVARPDAPTGGVPEAGRETTPQGSSHRAPAGTTVVLDWATLGAGPVGADLAALALSTFADPLEHYLAGAGGRFVRADVECGYRATLALTGAGRVHWMATRGVRPPDGYEDFILSQAP
ncbi:phosphotransferase [Nonomuraea phyllanthi]|uniref:Phosphotransferase n=1 Tax=Nonomuraea phyllanthi TaxID=2219224 RepID=A0A5C4WR24_9ACTN|nr:phosphotransferase [Nonomuraea phyllanthi]KAB8195322.1 phosphotransferase [Nonomuraea phyllanthi]